MRSPSLHLLVFLGGLAIAGVPAIRAATGSRAAVGMRYHAHHSIFEELPFDDGDLSYGIAFEYFEKSALWQLALDVAPDTSGSTSTNTEVSVGQVLTPQLNLLFGDGHWLFGAGALIPAGMNGAASSWKIIILGFSEKPCLSIHE